MTSRYAEGTSVPMERSRAEAEKTLIRYGASGFHYGWQRRTEPWPHPLGCGCGGTNEIAGKPCTRAHYGVPKTLEREVVLVEFLMGNRRVRLDVPMPHQAETGSAAKAEAATRQRWRALVLVLKAKLEAVASGISTLEAEFLANIVTGDGQTVGQIILPRMSEAVAAGRLLPPAGGGTT